ncbi:MAG: ClbS/DfsB family four-helix bundle protein [Anaerolineae bacterium]
MATAITTKSDMLRAMDEGRRVWEETLAKVSEARMEETGVVGDWTTKDLVAHVGFWERWVGGKLTASLEGRETSILGPFENELPTEAKDWDTDQLNAWVYQRNRARPVAEVVMEEQQIYRRLYTTLRGMRDEDLFTPGRFPWAREPVVEAVAGNTYDHWPEHVQSINEWLAR